MSYVLADQHSWFEDGRDPFDFKVLNTFENMINSVRYAMASTSLINVEMGALQRLCGSISRLRSTTTRVAFVILAIYILRTATVDLN
jgi:hypothetical protein